MYLSKKLALALNPDFTKVTPEGDKDIDKSEKRGIVNDDEIDRETIGSDE